MTCSLVMLALTASCMWSMTKNRTLLKLLREKEKELQFTEQLLYGEDEQ